MYKISKKLLIILALLISVTLVLHPAARLKNLQSLNRVG